MGFELRLWRLLAGLWRCHPLRTLALTRNLSTIARRGSLWRPGTHRAGPCLEEVAHCRGITPAGTGFIMWPPMLCLCRSQDLTNTQVDISRFSTVSKGTCCLGREKKLHVSRHCCNEVRSREATLCPASVRQSGCSGGTCPRQRRQMVFRRRITMHHKLEVNESRVFLATMLATDLLLMLNFGS